MPGKFFMGRDFRRDHFFRIPDPVLSKKVGSPDVCSSCHNNKSDTWIEEGYKRLYDEPKSLSKNIENSRYRYGELFQKIITKKDSKDIKELIDIIRNSLKTDSLNPIVTSTALNLLTKYKKVNSPLEKVFDRALLNKDTSIKYEALKGIAIDNNNIEKIYKLLLDPIKTIRIEAASQLFYQNVPIGNNYKEAYEKALKEYKEVQEYNLDFPISKVNLGNYYANKKEYQKAEDLYKRAIEQDEKLSPAYIQLGYLFYEQNNTKEAVEYFKKYLSLHENDYEVIYQAGLMLAELEEYEESLTYFSKAKGVVEDNDRLVLNYAKVLAVLGKYKEAEKELFTIIKDDVTGEYHLELLKIMLVTKQNQKAKLVIEKIKKYYPHIAKSYKL